MVVGEDDGPMQKHNLRERTEVIMRDGILMIPERTEKGCLRNRRLQTQSEGR